jgi:hypothetical protein
VPIELSAWLVDSRSQTRPRRSGNMGKGNNSQKNDKKNLKPKQDKAKPAAKK